MTYVHAHEKKTFKKNWGYDVRIILPARNIFKAGRRVKSSIGFHTKEEILRRTLCCAHTKYICMQGHDTCCMCAQ